MSSNDWNDINSPGVWHSPEPKPEKPKYDSGDEVPPPPREPAPPEWEFAKGKFEPDPTDGFAPNKTATLNGSGKWLKESQLVKIECNLSAKYKDKTQDLGLPENYKYAEIDDKGSFTFSLRLFLPNGYPTANKENFTDPIQYRADITHPRCAKPLIVTIDLPAKANKKVPILKRGMYDDNANEFDPEKYPKDGKGYIEGAMIYDLQKNILAKLRYSCHGDDPGFYGEYTEAMVKEFQRDSSQKLRLSENTHLLVEASRTFFDNLDGIVGPKTRDEIQHWQINHYLRPIPELYFDDFDQEAVFRGIKQKNNGSYHATGKPILEMQENLQKINLYKEHKKDGWFGEKMKTEVSRLQEALKSGEFITADGKPFLLPEAQRLKKFVKGVLCFNTGAGLKNVVRQGLKVADKKTIDTKISYEGDITHIAGKAESILKDILREADISSVTISSTVRTPADQARIMYENIESYGVAQQKKLYGTNGDVVIDVYSDLKAKKKSKSEIEKEMEDKIIELGSTTISKHCCDPTKMSIFDVAPSSVPDSKKSAFVLAMKNNKELHKYILPPTDPAYHLEVIL